MRIAPVIVLFACLAQASALGQGSNGASECSEKATQAEAATKTEKGPDSGTKNPGSTGWSGSGLGGSHNGTANSGPTKGSATDHPPTAKGLDPTKPSPLNPKC